MAAYSRPTAEFGKAGRRSSRWGSYLLFFGVFLLVMFGSHLWALTLPYFWDEAGQYIPTALD